MANNTAMGMYKRSLQTLLDSDNFDFIVYKITDWNEVVEDLEEWQDYKMIDKEVYALLHANLCKKLKERLDYL